MKGFLQAESFSVHHCRAPHGPRAAVPCRVLKGNGVGKLGEARRELLALALVGKDCHGRPWSPHCRKWARQASLALRPFALHLKRLRMDMSGMRGHTNRAVSFWWFRPVCVVNSYINSLECKLHVPRVQVLKTQLWNELMNKWMNGGMNEWV